MTETFDPIARLSALKLPMPNSSQLAFCGGAKTARLQHWVDQLRATQATQTAVLLYGALPELLRLKAEASLKHELLEVLRPSVHQAILGLTREFLHQPLNLPETAQKTAIVAQALQKFMIDGYTQVILETLKSSKSTQQGKQAFTEALHRAITALGQLFCRSFQLYTQVPSGLWSHLHLLYQVACAFEQEQEAVNDTLASKGLSRIKEAYTRVLALGAARLNQVAQQDVPKVFEQLVDWSAYIRLESFNPEDKDSAFWIHMDADRGPLSRDHYQNRVAGPLLALNFRPLLQAFERPDLQDNLSSHKRPHLPEDFPQPLLNHLRQAWAGDSYRDLDRKGAGQSAKLAIGLFESHFQLAGEQAFDRFCQEETNRYDVGLPSFANLSKLSDKREPDAAPAALGASFDVSLVNQSPGGYCVQWQQDASARVESGDLVALREQGRRSWNLCVVRWIRRLKDGSRLGLQLLSPNPQAYAVAAQYDDGSYSGYMRGFLLPARPGTAQPTLLTPTLPFQENQSVRLKLDGRVLNGKLDRCLFATSKVRQFTFTAFNPEE